MVKFIGYNSIDEYFGSVTLQDVDLAKRDLLNHFYTRKGERLGSPTFGSILPLMVFEPLDDISIEIIENDIDEIISLDPRWILIDKIIVIGQNSITCDLKLRYNPTLTIEQLYLKFSAEES
jgi:phage baseplate assembly protein W